MNKKFFDKSLPKWPALLVKGESVTKEQAMEIIIRTDSLSFSSNDSVFDRMLNEILYEVDTKNQSVTTAIKAKLVTEDWAPVWGFMNDKKSELGHIALGYLDNSQIVSSWIGGPHGWCNWDGKIETSNYNIGKWPTVEEVYNDWCKIAEAFPFLNLRSQLMDCEAGETEAYQTAKPIIEFIIKNGKVEMIEPTEQLIPLTEVDFSTRFLNNNFERGCTINQFKDAYELVKTKFSSEKLKVSI